MPKDRRKIAEGLPKDRWGAFCACMRIFFFLYFKNYLYLCALDMTKYNPNMTLHKLFLNIKKRDVYTLL